MRKTYFTIIVAILVAIFVNPIVSRADSDNQKPTTTHKPIIVVTEIPDIIRTLNCPISSYYNNSSVYISFEVNMGISTVAIQNLTAGGQVAEHIDTGMGNVVIDIDSILTVGNYYMTITTMSGDVYYAEFTLE